MLKLTPSPPPWQQMLRRRHAPLFSLLGKTSAREGDKLAAVEGAGQRLVQRYGCPTLEGGP